MGQLFVRQNIYYIHVRNKYMIHSTLSPIFHGDNPNVVGHQTIQQKNPHQGVNSKTKK